MMVDLNTIMDDEFARQLFPAVVDNMPCPFCKVAKGTSCRRAIKFGAMPHSSRVKKFCLEHPTAQQMLTDQFEKVEDIKSKLLAK